MRPIWEYCKRCQKKPTTIMGIICGYCNECYKNPTNTMDRYAGIATNEECQLVKISTGVGIATKPQNSSW